MQFELFNCADNLNCLHENAILEKMGMIETGIRPPISLSSKKTHDCEGPASPNYAIQYIFSQINQNYLGKVTRQFQFWVIRNQLNHKLPQWHTQQQPLVLIESSTRRINRFMTYAAVVFFAMEQLYCPRKIIEGQHSTGKSGWKLSKKPYDKIWYTKEAL